jgi:hypothetical protein
MECDYFYLRALTKNMNAVRSKHFQEHAMWIAFVDGSSEHYRRIRELAWPNLRSEYRILDDCASLWASFARKHGGVIKREDDLPRGGKMMFPLRYRPALGDRECAE